MAFSKKVEDTFNGNAVIPSNNINNKKTGISKMKRKDNIFLFTLLIVPVLQFIIFFVGVNFNSIMLAFQKYNGSAYEFVGFENFIRVIKDLFVIEDTDLARPMLSLAFKNSLIQFVVGLIAMPMQILVAYAVYKKVPFSGFFKIMLFLPQIISSMVFVICIQTFLNGLPDILPEIFPTKILDAHDVSGFTSVLIFGFWMGFANGLVIYLSAMSSLPEDVMEYCKLEKMSSIKEFWHIVVPLIFPTITTYVVVAFAGFFTNYGFFFAFYGGSKDIESSVMYDTLGLKFFGILVGDGSSGSAAPQNYPYASAGGLLFTLVCAPITIGVKALLEKYGPSEE